MKDKTMCVNQDCPITEECSRHTECPHLYTEISVFNWHNVDGFTMCDDFVEYEHFKKENNE